MQRNRFIVSCLILNDYARRVHRPASMAPRVVLREVPCPSAAEGETSLFSDEQHIRQRGRHVPPHRRRGKRGTRRGPGKRGPLIHRRLVSGASLSRREKRASSFTD